MTYEELLASARTCMGGLLQGLVLCATEKPAAARSLDREQKDQGTQLSAITRNGRRYG